MSNPTSNFNWQMPTATDLVTDLPADFEVFGQAVDSTLADLKGGTTGQILAKNSNTDMDFVWQTAAPGDITGVTAGTGISGGGTSGDVTITNSMATALTTKGDIIVATGSGAFVRQGVGTNGQVLTADSTQADGVIWATPSAPSFIGARAFANNDQSVPNSTLVTVGFNDEVFDTNGFHDNSTNNSRMTVPAGLAGKYRLDCNLFYSGNTSSNRVVEILKNGNIIAWYASGAGTSNGFTQWGNLIVDAAVGDYFQVRTSQNSGTTLTIFGSVSLSPGQGVTSFNFQYLGA